MSVISDFRLSKEEAKVIVREVGTAVSHWREVAHQFQLAKREIDRVASAFEHQDLEQAIRV